MISKLPLFFADGRPTILERMRVKQLERFVMYMLKCSLGVETSEELYEPKWWPKGIEFINPFVNTLLPDLEWRRQLRRVIHCCYAHYNSGFIMEFSQQFRKLRPFMIKYENNMDNTISIFYRPTGALMVTFRANNLYYDKPKPEFIENPLLYVKNQTDSDSSSSSSCCSDSGSTIDVEEPFNATFTNRLLPSVRTEETSSETPSTSSKKRKMVILTEIYALPEVLRIKCEMGPTPPYRPVEISEYYENMNSAVLSNFL